MNFLDYFSDFNSLDNRAPYLLHGDGYRLSLEFTVLYLSKAVYDFSQNIVFNIYQNKFYSLFLLNVFLFYLSN